MRFLSLDVETANPDFSSICQIGIATFDEETITETWTTLINPKDYFDPFNISIHGITPKDVKRAPTYRKIFPLLKDLLTGQIITHHTPFDKIAISQAAENNNLDLFRATWIDTAKVARRTWSDFAYKGYGLANVANKLNIEFQHHNALEDAIAAGRIMIEAIKISGLDLSGWFDRIKKPISGVDYNSSIRQNGNPEGPLFGENLTFTGTLSIQRKQIAEMAAVAGCNVSNSVTADTTIIVVGIQDLRKTFGREKSNKHRKAETLIAKGQYIQIISENDFLAMVK